MEGETYGSISRASESGILTDKTVEFLHGRRTQEGLFRVLVERRITRTKYLVRDLSGRGILNLEKIDSNTLIKTAAKTSPEQEVQLFVRGSVNSEEKQEFPILEALTVSLFTFEGALQEMLSSHIL